MYEFLSGFAICVTAYMCSIALVVWAIWATFDD